MELSANGQRICSELVSNIGPEEVSYKSEVYYKYRVWVIEKTLRALDNMTIPDVVYLARDYYVSPLVKEVASQLSATTPYLHIVLVHNLREERETMFKLLDAEIVDAIVRYDYAEAVRLENRRMNVELFFSARVAELINLHIDLQLDQAGAAD